MHQVEVATTQETLLDSPEMVLNMGPQHPSTHGVLRVILRLDGETVIDLDCDIGFLHRGMEKIAENRLYPMIAPYWDRLDYIAAVSNGPVWGETVEQVLGVRNTRGGRPTPPLLAPPLARHACARHRSLHRPAPRTARARRDSEDIRAAVRRASHLPRVAHRRHAERRLRRLYRGRAAVRR